MHVTHVIPRDRPRDASVSDEIAEFRRQCRKALANAFHPDEVVHFRPTRRNDARLKHVGFSSPLACVALMPCWADDVWRYIVTRCAMLRGANAAVADAILHDGIALPYIRLKLRRVAPWKCDDDRINEPGQACAWMGSCPACKGCISLPVKPFKLESGWSFAWCPHCRRQRRMGRATCSSCTLMLMHCACRGGRNATLHELWKH